jgi:hypothetical protein
VKVLQLLHPKLAEHITTRYYGALKGTVHGDLHNLLSPTTISSSPNNAQYTPPALRTLEASPNVDLKDEICCLQIELVEEAQDN